MKKTSLLLGTLILQLSVANAQQTEPSKNVRRVKTLLESRLNDVMKVNALRARDGEETPLAQGRRIVKQEYFSDISAVPDRYIDYGYTSANKGQEFHPSMMIGFPMDISIAGRTDHVLFGSALFSAPDYNFPLHELGAEIVIDTINTYAEGSQIRSVVAQRGANNRIDVLTQANDYGSYQTVEKKEKFYTNNLLTRIDAYYQENLSAFVMGSRRVIAYDNNQRIVTDTVFSYDMGTINETTVLEYTYNSSGDVSEITSNADNGYSGVVVVDYYTDGRYKSHEMSFYLAGALLSATKDSIAYAANGFIARKKFGYGDNNGNGTIEFEYNIVDMIYNGNLLDTVKMIGIDQMGQVSENGFGKYHYSIDHNPDSLMVTNISGMTPDEKLIFHYEPYNTTSVKHIARNNNFNIYPNPIESTLNIYNKVTLKDRKATIMITDIKGSRIWSVEQVLTPGANQVNIPASLSAGTYVISITADNSVYTQKVIKQ